MGGLGRNNLSVSQGRERKELTAWLKNKRAAGKASGTCILLDEISWHDQGVWGLFINYNLLLNCCLNKLSCYIMQLYYWGPPRVNIDS